MIEEIISHGSYLAIVVVLLFTGNGLPIPEELLVVTAGVLSANGFLNPWLAALSCLLGAFGGDCLTYYLGYRFGHRIFRGRHFWNRLVTPEREARVEEMFRRHGFKVLFVARFLVGLRPAIHLTAGILRLPVRRYLLTDLFCTSIVVGTFFALSYFFGQPIFAWIRRFEILVTVVVVLAVGVAILLVRRRARRRKARQADGANVPEEGGELAESPLPESSEATRCEAAGSGCQAAT
jgi:membrane protein DedA with SNARE-associated domain